MKIRKKGNTAYISVPRKGKLAPSSKGLTTKETMNSWIQGFMGGARKRRKFYHQLGIKRFTFSYKGKKTSRKI